MRILENNSVNRESRIGPAPNIAKGAGWRLAVSRVSESPLFPIALIIALVFILYARALAGSFVHDDEQQIVENVFVTNPHLWRHIFTGSVWSFAGLSGFSNFYRPLMIFSFWMIDRLAGPQPFFFHLIQVSLFAAAAVIVYVIGKDLLGSKTAALLGSLLWVMHPQKVEAVAWVSAMCDTGCGLFYLLAFFLFLRGEETQNSISQDENESGSPRHSWMNDALAAIALFIALLFKEMAVSFPLLIGTYWFFHPKKGMWLRRGIRLMPYAGALSAYLIIRRLALGHLTQSGHLFHITAKLLVDSAALFGAHTRIFFWPSHLSVFREFVVEKALHSPWPWATLLVIAAVIIFRKKNPDLSFLVLWWPVALLPCLDIRQLSTPLVADRMTYIPSLGLCMAIGYFVIKGLTWQRTSWATRTRGAVSAGLAVLMILWCAVSVRAISHWRDNQTLVNYSLKQSPDISTLHVIRAWDLEYRKNDLAGAMDEFDEAIRLNHQNPKPAPEVDSRAKTGLGEIALREGHREKAIVLFRQAMRIAPRLIDPYMAMGSVYMPHGNYARAAEFYEKAVKADVYNTDAKFLLGTCWMKLGKYDEASQMFHSAREVDPHFWAAYQAEAQALDLAGKHQEAARVRALIKP